MAQGFINDQGYVGIPQIGTSTDRGIVTWNGTGGNAVFNNSTMNVDSTGRMTNSAQPMLAAYRSANIPNVSGDGTKYTLALDSTYFDVGSNYNTGTYTYTFPVTGYYLISLKVIITGLTSSHTSSQLFIGSGSNYSFINPWAINVPGLGCTLTNTALVGLASAGQTIQFFLQVSNGTKVVGLAGGEFTQLNIALFA